MKIEELEKQILKVRDDISQVEYCPTTDQKEVSFIFRVNGKRFGGRIKYNKETEELDEEGAKIFLRQVKNT